MGPEFFSEFHGRPVASCCSCSRALNRVNYLEDDDDDGGGGSECRLCWWM